MLIDMYCIGIMISMTTIIIPNPAIQTSLFFSTFSARWHEKRDTTHKSLCQPHNADIHTHTHVRATHFVVSKISTYLCRSRHKLIYFDQIRKTQLRTLKVETQLPVFSKSSNSQDRIFMVRLQSPIQFTLTTIQPNFLSGCLLWQMIIVISFPNLCKSASSDYTPEVRDTELFKALLN